MYFNLGVMMVLALLPLLFLLVTTAVTIWIVKETLKVGNYFKERVTKDDN